MINGNSMAKYLTIVSLIENEVSLDTLKDKLFADRNSILILLFELKSIGWIDTKDFENWYMTDFGKQAKKLCLNENLEKKQIDTLISSIVVTFPREYGSLSDKFPNFIETARLFKNELTNLKKGDELNILSYAVDFKVLSSILEDPDIINCGNEKDFRCNILFFNGYNENEIDKIRQSGFNLETHKLKMTGPGNPHAKVIIFNKKEDSAMIISSANLTDNVFTTRNLEVGIYTKDIYLIKQVEDFYSWLWRKITLE
jgi:adenylate kinase family enzyme